MLKTKIAVAVIIACCSTQFAYAEAQETIERITVTGTPYQGLPAHKHISVEVIEREKIERIAPVDLPSLLEQVAGFSSSRQGGRGQLTSVFARGTNSNHTIVLIDGVRVGSASLGQTNLSLIRPSQIERIEVYKGAHAAQYGADAIGSVIKIFTRFPEETQLTIKRGSNNYQNYDIAAGKTIEATQLAFQAGMEKTDGFSVFVDGDPDKDGMESKHLAFQLTHDVTSHNKVSYHQFFDEGSYEYDSPFQGGADVAFYRRGQSQFKWEQSQNNFSQYLSMAQNRDKEKYIGPNTDDLSLETKHQEATYQFTYHPVSFWQAYAGLQWLKDNVSRSSTSFLRNKRDNKAVFAGGRYETIKKTTIDAAIRYDHMDSTGKQTTYGLNISQALPNQRHIRLGYQTAFKQPSFNDLYSPTTGNPSLKSEESQQIEGSFRFEHQVLTTDITVFRQEIDNLISWTQDENSSVWTPQNIYKAQIDGLEWRLKGKWDLWHNEFNYTWLDTENKTTNKPLANRARRTLNWITYRDWQQHQLSITFHYSDKRPTGNNDTMLPSYQTWSTSYAFYASEQLTLKLTANNLFDKEYQSNKGYRSLGREVIVSLKYTF
ncbi:TonB-dependent receptor domain-containing protein [Algicola sagamiensis]|uniref:TonB-dependent receptor domain-containing protein n=1 Tax=Algicola sagamiensis TaxID=163869 RepID=UPI00035E5F18|nr:TonB-dependent receptor [Algicola sagamiensis]